MEQRNKVRLMVAGAALGGVGLGGLFTGPGLAGAVQTDESTTTTEQPADGTTAPVGCRPGGGRGDHLAVAAEVLGMEPEALREALVGGQTLAEVAEANGVAVDDLVAALVAEAEEHLDDAVADGRITEEQAAQFGEDLTDRIEARVEGEFEGRHPGGPGGPGGPGHGGPGHGPRGERPVDDAEG